MTALTQGWRSFATTTTRLEGKTNNSEFVTVACGKHAEVVKHTLHLDMAGAAMYALQVRGGGVCQVGFRKSHVRDDPQ